MDVMHFSLKTRKEKNYWLGWFAISIYAFFWLIDLDISRAGESLFILCFVIAWLAEPDKRLKWHRVFLLFLAFLCLQAGVYFFAVERFPEFDQMNASRHMAKLFLCIAIAWWVRGSIKAAKYLISIFCVGFFCSLLVHSDLHSWVIGIQGKRVDFAYVNAQHTAVYFGLAFIFGICWFYRGLAYRKSLAHLSLSLSTTLVSGAGIIITQTRAVWLAMMVMLVFVSLVAAAWAVRTGQMRLTKPKLSIMAVCILIFVGLGAIFFKPIIAERIDAEKKIIISIFKGDIQDIPYSSVGNRIHTWHYALDKIEERPLTGWGPQSRKPLIDEGPFPGWVKERYGHFHNSYIEITLAYGVLGIALLSLLTLYIMKGVFRLSRSGHHYFYVGLLSSFVFFAVVNFFESYLIFRTGIYFYVIIGGVGMSFYLFGVNGERKKLND